uniref:Folliculin n=1 Tax=Panagrolaimus sp. JU765 TaxID=591449 RepID=A0AC34QXS9_9BILA
MNAFPSAVVSLCHFCENHGPRIIMVTQAIPRGKPGINTPFLTKYNHRTNLPWDKIAQLTAQAENRINVLSVIDCHKNLDVIDDDKNDGPVFGYWDRKVELVDEEKRCDACSSVTESGAHVANDYQAERSYITTEQALNDECYMALKKALFRAMIGEKLNNANDYDFANAMTPTPSLASPTDNSPGSSSPKPRNKRESLSDSNEEGVLLFWSDEDGYSAIARTFMVEDARSRGFRRRYMLLVLSKEREVLFSHYKLIIGELNTTAKLIQIASKRIYNLEQKFDQTAAKWMPSEFLKSKIILDTGRSLAVLVGDDDAFFYLHKDFVGILQRLFKYELSDEPLLNKNKIEMANQQFERFLAFQAFKDLKYIQKQIPTEMFKQLIWHICSGKQVIVRSDGAVPRKQFLFALTLFLPSKLIKFEPNSGIYLPIGSSNFLGIDRETEWPEDETNIFVFTVKSRMLNLKIFNAKILITKSPTKIFNSKIPKIVSKFWQILDPRNKIPLESQFYSLTNTKITFLDYVEVITEMSKTIDKMTIIKMMGGTNSDLEVHLFWSTILEEKSKVSFKLLPIQEETEELQQTENKKDNFVTRIIRDEQQLIVDLTEKLSKLQLNAPTKLSKLFKESTTKNTACVRRSKKISDQMNR